MKRIRLWRGRVWAIDLVLLAVGFGWRYQLVWVSGDSMLPTFRNGDWLLMVRRAYVVREPKRGEIVIARYGAGKMVKRVVGLPGEIVELRGGALWVNGQPCPSGAPREEGILEIGRGRLREGRYALVGDNRSLAVSVADHGVVGREDLRGKVVLRWWPSWDRVP